MKCLTATIDCSSLPSNHVVSWLHCVNEQDPTFVHVSTDEEDEEFSDESSDELTALSHTHSLSQPDHELPNGTGDQEQSDTESDILTGCDPELEALKKRFEKYLTKKDTSIDVGSYDIADPFIDDTMETTGKEEGGKEVDDSNQNISSLKFCVVGWNSSTNAPNLTSEQSVTVGKRTKPSDKGTLLKEKKPKKAKLSQAPTEQASQLQDEGEGQSQPTESTVTTSKSKSIDYELDIALVEFHQAQEAFIQAASQKSITDRTKFPASLQLPLWNYFKWQILSCPEHTFDEEQLAQLVAKTLPFSTGSVRKLLFKVIVPEMLIKMIDENKTIFNQLKLSLQQKQTKLKETNDGISASQPITTESQEVKGTATCTIQTDENEKRLIYEYLKGEFDLFIIRGSISKLEEPQATIPTEISFRRGQYQKTQADLNDLLPSSLISSQYSSYKKRVWRKMCKELKT